jgi:hypothetical protein
MLDERPGFIIKFLSKTADWQSKGRVLNKNLRSENVVQKLYKKKLPCGTKTDASVDDKPGFFLPYRVLFLFI